MTDYADLEKRLRERAPYYTEWAKDIRALNGTSVDADHADATARDLLEAAAALASLARDKTEIITDHIALEDALANWPKLPPKPVLRNLGGHMSQWPEDWERGKVMQREFGLDLIPPKTEYECGAGLWDRITNGAWRTDLSRALPSQDETT